MPGRGFQAFFIVEVVLSVRPDLQQIFDVKLTSLKLKMVSVLQFPNCFHEIISPVHSRPYQKL